MITNIRYEVFTNTVFSCVVLRNNIGVQCLLSLTYYLSGKTYWKLQI